MGSLKVSILGAKGIGKYHAREFALAGCDVSIFGRTKESANESARIIKDNFGLEVKAYDNLEKMIDTEKPKAISICTPPETHETLIKKCLERGLNVLCEKPLVTGKGIVAKTFSLLDMANKRNKILTVNTQWPSILKTLEKNNAFEYPLKKFEAYMEPGEKGEEMLIDHLPHSNSLLVELVTGEISNIQFEKKDEEEIIVNFNYGPCKARYHFKYNPHRPRTIEFSFNSRKFVRRIGENYQQSFEEKGRSPILIEDPLKSSIKKFIDSIKGKGLPLIESKKILESARIANAIVSEYNKNSEYNKT